MKKVLLIIGVLVIFSIFASALTIEIVEGIEGVSSSVAPGAPTLITAPPIVFPSITTITQIEKPIVEEIKYGDKKVLGVSIVPGAATGTYIIQDVQIDPSKGILNVEFTPSDGATYYSVEIWGLTGDENKAFQNLTAGAGAIAWKDGEREKQFILSQGSFKLALGKTSFSITSPINLVGLIDQSNSEWYPKRDIQRCKDKYVWVNSSATAEQKIATCKDTGTVDSTWALFSFQKFYDYIKSQKRDFYLVVETNAEPKDSSKWKDSVLIPLNITEPTAPPVVTGECNDIAQCKAMLDLKFIENVLEKKNVIDSADLADLTELQKYAILKAKEFGLGPDGMVLALFERESGWNPNSHGDFDEKLKYYTSFGLGQLRVDEVQKCIDSSEVQITSVSDLTTLENKITRDKMKAMDPKENIACTLYRLKQNSITPVTYSCSTNSILEGGPDVIYSGLAAGLRRHNGLGCTLNAKLYPLRYIPSSVGNYYAWDFIPAVVDDCKETFSKYGCDISDLEIVKTPATKGQSVSYYA